MARILKISCCILFFTCLQGSGPLWSQPASTVRVMTHNIKFDDTRDPGNDWAHRKSRVIGLLNFYEPVVFGIQEGLAHQVEDIKQDLDNFEYTGVGRDDGKKQGEYSAIFYNTSLFDANRSGTFWLSSTPSKPVKGWDAALPRICTWVELEHKETGKTMTVFNTHFDHVGVKAREKSAELILSKIEELGAVGPVVLMGDFNFTPGPGPYSVVTSSLRDARLASQAMPYGPEATFNGFRFDRAPTGRIDYVFVNKAIEVLRYGVLTDSQDLSYPSDHFPVMVDLKIHARD